MNEDCLLQTNTSPVIKSLLEIRNDSGDYWGKWILVWS